MELVNEHTEEIRWVPHFGQFDFDDRSVSFVGRSLPVSDQEKSMSGDRKEQPAIGVALSSLALADGRISADVVFEKVTSESTCEMLVSYDVNANHFVTAGLGGESLAMFGIREYRAQQIGGKGWWYHYASGDRASLKPDKEYHIEAELCGASVTIYIDDIPVGSAVVASPIGRVRQIGLFCRGTHRINVKNFSAVAVKPRAFVVMQFGGEYDDVYKDVVQEVCESYEVSVLRADEVSGPGLIISDIIREIVSAQLVIADITPANPNVYFEVGYSLAVGKPTILLAQKGTSLPFDVAGFRVLFYEDSIGGKRKLEVGLRRHLAAILST